MRLKEALKDGGATYVLAEATLARLGLTDEAAVTMTGSDHALTGAAVACDKGLVVFTVGGPARSRPPFTRGATSLHRSSPRQPRRSSRPRL